MVVPTGDEAFAYLREVERFWVLLRRRGFMLSPKDVQQVEAWAAAGIPARVACRGLLEGADRFRERNPNESEFPNSLRYFQSTVEATAKRHAARQLTAPESDGEPEGDSVEEGGESGRLDARALLPTLVEAGRATVDERVRQAYRNAWRALDDLHAEDAATLVERLVDIDRTIVDDVWDALTQGERETIQTEVDDVLDAERDHLGELGLRERSRGLLEDAVARRWDLLRIVPGPPEGPRVVGMGWWRARAMEEE